MGLKGSYEEWVNLGYQLFSEEGHEGFQVDRLARILGRNKSSFYHYFPEKELYIKSLIDLHWKNAIELRQKYTEVEEFDPGFIRLLIENKQLILFHMNLIRNKDVKIFKEVFQKINDFIDPAIIPIWAKEFSISESLARQLFPTARDVFYCRLTKDNFTEDFVRDFVREIKEFIGNLLQEKSLVYSGNAENPNLN